MDTSPPQHSNPRPNSKLSQSQVVTESMGTTSLESIQQELTVLQTNKDRWVTTGIDERIAILDEIRQDLLTVTDHWVAMCVEAKGIPAHTHGELFEWNMLLTIFSLLTSLRRSLKDIKKYGHPHIAGSVFMYSDGQVAAKVFPRTKFESMLFHGLSIEVRMEPGVSIEDALRTQAHIYRERYGQGAVSVVLGAGNASALQVADLLYKLFITNHVVILKLNPVNAYLEPLIKIMFRTLIKRGFIRVVCGGAEEGSYLCHTYQFDFLRDT